MIGDVKMRFCDIDIYNPKELDLEKRFNIGFGVSEVFGRPLGVSITSILENNKDMGFNIHIFYEELPTLDIEYLKKTADKYEQVIYFHKFKNFKDMFKNVKYDSKVWQATYFRLVAVDDMPEFVKSLLWLDSDICCCGSLKEIFEIDMKEYPIAAVNHAEQKELVSRSIERLKLKSKKYFNAGIIYFNLEQWNKMKLSEKTFAMIEYPKKEWEIYDQDMFNSLIDGNYYELDYIYNFQRLGGCSKYKSIPDNLKIFHYVGMEKPWYKYKNEFQEKWLKYSNISFWRDVPLLVPEKTKNNASYFRYMSYSAFKDKNIIEAISYYITYVILKLK